MKRAIAFLMIAACCAAPASDIPPRETPKEKPLSREERFATRGQVDLYVASTVSLDLKPEDERLWVPVLKLGVRATESANRKPEGGPTWAKEFAAYRKSHQPEFIRTDGVYTRPKEDAAGQQVGLRQAGIQADGVNADASLMGLVVSRGPVNVKKILWDSLIVSTGDVTAQDIVNSVVICDGDVVTLQVMSSLIIARGKIEVKGKGVASTLIAGSTVTIAKMPPPPVLGLATSPEIQERNNRLLAEFERVRVEIQKEQTKPLGFITFFELRQVGLDVKVAKGEVQVAKVAASSACEKAGVKVGDVVVDVGGKKPTDAESLRRLLRDALAIGDATVKLQRGNETISAKVSLPE